MRCSMHCMLSCTLSGSFLVSDPISCHTLHRAHLVAQPTYWRHNFFGGSGSICLFFLHVYYTYILDTCHMPSHLRGPRCLTWISQGSDQDAGGFHWGSSSDLVSARFPYVYKEQMIHWECSLLQYENSVTSSCLTCEFSVPWVLRTCLCILLLCKRSFLFVKQPC